MGGDKKDQVLQLLQEGKTYREIMYETGIKSTSGVAYYAKDVHVHKLIQSNKDPQYADKYYGCRKCKRIFEDVTDVLSAHTPHNVNKGDNR
jgi:hypothetical protein